MDVTFTRPSLSQIMVAGFFAGDGSGGAAGNVWRVLLNPDEAGTWSYSVSFHEGSNAAVNPGTGTTRLPDGVTGNFVVAERDIAAPGFKKWGLLEYQESGPTLARYYLKFRDGPYFIKGGANGPEDFLGYAGFDNTPAPATDGTAKGILFDYGAHVIDWNAGDPTWTTTNPDSVGDDGKGIIGALNYLASHNVNTIFFVVNTIGGDTQETYPWVGPIVNRGGDQASGYTTNDNTHYDLSKLEQWEIVFDHAQEKGIYLHVTLNEGEGTNKRELDDGVLGTERKLFYRELIARFAHHNAMQWNACIEYDGKFDPPSGATGEQLQFAPATIREFADYLNAADPYDHPTTVHNTGRRPEESFDAFVGDTQFGITSFQDFAEIGGIGSGGTDAARTPGLLVETMRETTATNGRPLPISLDELRSTVEDGLPEHLTGATHEDQRRAITWPTFLSGGNYENHLHLAEDPPGTGWDHDTQVFDLFQQSFEWMWYARRFVEQLPFWEMQPNDDRITNDSDAEVFEKPGEYYAVYLPNSGDPTIDLADSPGTFMVRWIDPLTGLVVGSDTSVSGGALRTLARPAAIADEAAFYLWRDDVAPPGS